MKTIIRYLVPLAGIAAALPALRAEDTGTQPEVKKEMRVLSGPDDNAPPPDQRERRIIKFGPHEMESVTFLGIATSPAGATLDDQLDLPKDAGLVVNTIMPGSPAASVLKRHDVLVKLDDQLLIEQRQLSVLVRNHQEGDEVTLTYIRGGKEATAKVKLGKHDMPRMAMMGFGPGPNWVMHPGDDGEALPGQGREDMDRMLSLMDHNQAFGPDQQHFGLRIERSDQEPGMHSVTVNTSNSNMVYSDEQGTLDLTIKDGQKTLIAKNAKGEQLYSGPVNTPAERKALPADVRARLDKLENMQGYSFKTDGDFQPGETKDVRPQHQGIVLPREPAPASRPPAFF